MHFFFILQSPLHCAKIYHQALENLFLNSIFGTIKRFFFKSALKFRAKEINIHGQKCLKKFRNTHVLTLWYNTRARPPVFLKYLFSLRLSIPWSLFKIQLNCFLSCTIFVNCNYAYHKFSKIFLVSIETTYIKIRLDIYGFYADYLDIIKVLNTINFNKKKKL